MKPRLTIAIPTYERPDALRATVSVLLPQLTADVSLIVLDNHSPTPAESILQSLFLANPQEASLCRVHRHAANVGGNANILRCLEFAEGEWVWTLGDDDYPAPNAVSEILVELDSFPQADHFNFSSSLFRRTSSWTADNLDDFLDRCDSLPNELFISANVYRRDRFVPYLSTALNHAGTNMAQLALLFSGLQEGRVTNASTRFIMGWEALPEDQRWPSYFFFNFLNLAEVLPNHTQQRKLMLLMEPPGREAWKPWVILRWAMLGQFKYSNLPSALLFLSQGAHLRALLHPHLWGRMRWRLTAALAGFAHRTQFSLGFLWRGLFRLLQGKNWATRPVPTPYKGHHFHLTAAPKDQ